ncbi:MAG TPA: hypothetical protein VD928_01415, partial [Candidatus Paceibacterota bacterium]|nr:hypothetical protein [Candidatus Paceibacterota bacterium]
LAEKPEFLVLTKSDTKESKYIGEVQKKFKKEFKKDTITVSILDDESVRGLQEALTQALSRAQ